MDWDKMTDWHPSYQEAMDRQAKALEDIAGYLAEIDNKLGFLLRSKGIE